MRRGLVALLLVAACMVEPTESFQPAPVYRTWFAELEACSGRRNSFEGIRWAVRERGSETVNGREIVGQIDYPNHIWIVRAYLDVEGAVKHEMLHYLLQQQKKRHPTPPFGVCTGGF